MKDLTTLVCLFHHDDHAQAAEQDLNKAGISSDLVTVIGGSRGSIDDLDKSKLASFGMPDRDYDHLKNGLRDGGVVLAVSAIAEHVSNVESIFGKYCAEKIDEADVVAAVKTRDAAVSAEAATTVPIVQEDLVVGKRTVDQGGVRLYRRVVEIPVEESINLREEHITVDHRAVDRPVNTNDLAFEPRIVELTETAEEAVVAKEARVVEEIVVSKEAIEHTETINETVRHTEVEVEELPSGQRAAKTNDSRRI